MFSKKLAALVALSMMTASGAAVAQSAAPLSLAQAPAVSSGAELEESSDIRGGFLLPLAAIVAIIVAVVLLTGGGDDAPTSP